MDKSYINEIRGETAFESRLFSGFADAFPNPYAILEPPFCMEMMYRRIENEQMKKKMAEMRAKKLN